MRNSYRVHLGRLLLLWVLANPAVAATLETSTFTNHDGLIRCAPEQIAHPVNEDEVARVVRAAVAEGRSVKAASKHWKGSNHSSCVAHGGVQIDTSRLTDILAVDQKNRMVTVQPGIKLWDLNQIAHKQWGLTLPVVQEYADVTIGGMLGNGTHGSSLVEMTSSIQDRLVSARLVDGSGDIRVIDGAELDYVATNLGVLGILTSVTLKLEPSFKVQAETHAFPDVDLDTKILGVAQSHYSTTVTWFPGQHSFTTTTYDKVPEATPGEARNGQVEVHWWQRSLMPLAFKAAHTAPSRGLMCALEKERLKGKSHSYFTDKFAHPVTPAVGWVHEMTTFVCREHCPFAELPFTLEEIAIPLDDLPRFIQRAKELFAQAPTCLPLNGVFFRFGQGSRGAIGMAGGRATAYVGTEYVRNPYGNQYPRDFHVIQELEQILLKEFQGRPHWGKNFPDMFTGVEKKYPRFREFLSYRDKVDPRHIFENDFFASLSRGQELSAMGESCVVKESCYCRDDRHCPAGYQCQAGLASKDAHICMRKKR